MSWGLSGSDGRADDAATSGGLPQNSTAGPAGTLSRSRAPKPRRAGTDLAQGTRTVNPLGAWLDDQSADSISPLLRAIVAHQSAGLLRRTSRRGNSRSRRRRSSQSWRSSSRSRGRTGVAGLSGDDSSCSRSVAYFFGLPRGRASSGIEFSATLAGQVPSLAVVKSSRRRRLPPSWPSRVASFWPFGLKAPRAGQPIFLSGHRRHGAPTFFIIGGSSPEHGRHPSSGIEWCAFGGIWPVS